MFQWEYSKVSFTSMKNCTEIDFLIYILTNIATEYLQNIIKPKINDQNSTKNTKNMIKLPSLPTTGPKLQKEF